MDKFRIHQNPAFRIHENRRYLSISKIFSQLPINNIKKCRNLIFPLMLIILPALLILRQPNLGTSLIIILTSLTILFIAGVRIQLFIYLGLSAVLSLPVIWRFLHDYQKMRILIFCGLVVGFRIRLW